MNATTLEQTQEMVLVQVLLAETHSTATVPPLDNTAGFLSLPEITFQDNQRISPRLDTSALSSLNLWCHISSIFTRNFLISLLVSKPNK